MGERFRQSLRDAPVVRFGEYDYFVHPLTDGVPAIDPIVLREVADDVVRVADLSGVVRIVTAEAMGIPIATAVSLATGIPYSVVRKRRYGLPGEVEIGQRTGYSKGSLFVNGLARGDRVLLVDDVVSTGGTLDAILGALGGMGVEVADVVVLVEKGEGREELEKRHGIRVKTLERIEVEGGRVRVA